MNRSSAALGTSWTWISMRDWIVHLRSTGLELELVFLAPGKRLQVL